MKLYLIRHGQASFAAQNYDQLSPKGTEQAVVLGQHFEHLGIKPDVVISGSMQRHLQTAQHSLAALLLPSPALFEQDSSWNEYDHSNILATYKPEFSSPESIRVHLADKPNAQLVFKEHFIHAIDRWINEASDPAYTDSWPSFRSRVQEAFELLPKQYQGKTVFVYTSGGPISLICSLLLALPSENFLLINWTLLNAGVTKIIHGRGGWLLSSLNSHDAFEGAEKKSLLTYV